MAPPGIGAFEKKRDARDKRALRQVALLMTKEVKGFQERCTNELNTSS